MCVCVCAHVCVYGFTVDLFVVCHLVYLGSVALYSSIKQKEEDFSEPGLVLGGRVWGQCLVPRPA